MSRVAAAALAFLLPLAAAVYAPPAEACGNSAWEFEEPKDRHEKNLLLARKALRERRFADAVKYAEVAVASKKREVRTQARMVAVDAAEADRKLEKALVHAEAALAEEKDGYHAFRVAKVESALGRNDAAARRLTELETRGEMPSTAAWMTLANARVGLGDRSGALRAVNAVLKKAPRHKAALALRAELEEVPALVPPPAKDAQPQAVTAVKPGV